VKPCRHAAGNKETKTMKTGKTLVELATEIERQKTAKRDYIADTRQMHLDGDGKTFVIDGQGAFQMTDHMLGQLGERTQVPLKYLRRMQEEAPALLAENANHWLHAKPERRMVRTLDNRARAFMSDRYLRIDNHDVAEATLPVLMKMPDLEIVSSEITESRLYIKAVVKSLTRQVTSSKRVGDMVEAGVMISNSEIGMGAIKIAPYAHFLVCLNGAVREGGKRWAHLGRIAGADDDGSIDYANETKQADDKALLLKVRDTLNSALAVGPFEAWIEKLNGATTDRLEGDVTKAVEVLGTTLSLNGDEKSSILRHLIEGADLSRYGVMNAITRYATDAKDYDRATELEAAGAAIIDLSPSDWKAIKLAA